MLPKLPPPQELKKPKNWFGQKVKREAEAGHTKTSNLWNLGLWKLSLTDEGRIFCWNLKCTVVCQRFFLPWLNFKIFFGSSSISDFGCYRCMACPIRPAGAHWFENWKRPATVELQRDNNLWFVNDNSGKRKFKVNKCKFESEVEKSLKSFEWKVSKLVKLVWSELYLNNFVKQLTTSDITICYCKNIFSILKCRKFKKLDIFEDVNLKCHLIEIKFFVRIDSYWDLMTFQSNNSSYEFITVTQTVFFHFM